MSVEETPASPAATEPTTVVQTEDVGPAATPQPRAMNRRVLGLAWPVIGENLLETLLGIVDTLLVAGLGAVAIAGVGSGLQAMFFLLSALSALAIGSSVLVAQSVGARDLGRAGVLARQSLVWGGAVSVPLAVGGLLLAGPVIGLFGSQPEVTRIGTAYLQVAVGTAIVLVALFIGGGVLRGAGDSRTPMVVTAIANVVNVGLAYGLIYGRLGLPRLGPVGSAWGTFLARALALVLLLRVLWLGRGGVSIRGRAGWRPQPGVAREIFKIGVPAALEQMLISSAFFALTAVVARLGTQSLAAYQLTFTALSFSFLPGIGFGIAATALVGQCVGAGRPLEAAAAAKIATGWATLWMGTIGLVLFVLAEPVLRVFSDDPEVVRIGARGLRIVALAQSFWAVLFVQAGAIRGTGDTRFPLLVNGIGFWLSVLLALGLLRLTGGGLLSVWASFLVIAPLMAGLLWWHFRRIVGRAVVGSQA